MNHSRLSLLLVLFLSGMPACGFRDHDHSGAAEDAAGHGDHAHDGEGAEPVVAVTHWTDRTELFMEYPVLVAGASGEAAVHVTVLEGFAPLADGGVIVSLRSAEGRVLEFIGRSSRAGIFGVDLEPDLPGTYEMTLRVAAANLEDLHELGSVTVHPSGVSPDAAEGDAGDGDGISFLKEQQWTLEFGTVPAELRRLRPSLTVPAVVRPRDGGEVTLAAPVPGRIDPATAVPVTGSRVPAGTILARIVPRSDDLRHAATLRAALVEAEQEYGSALRDRDRVERLVEARALPARRLDEARAALLASEARLNAARERSRKLEILSASGIAVAGESTFALRAPFDGIVADLRFAPGANVEENEPLLRLVDPDRVHIVGMVPESRAADLRSVDSGEIVLNGDPPIALSRPLSVGRIVEPVARTTEVRFAFENGGGRLAIGRSVQLRLFVGADAPGTAVPESAVVDDGGRPVVFVQTGGESFERRAVRLGSRAAGWVHILDGVAPGERVVDRGAYLVRLAALSTQIPSHGHVH